MIRFFGLMATLMLCFNLGVPAMAQEPDVPPQGASCDFTAVKNSLFSTESQGSGGYSAVNGIGAAGKYQFMPATRRDYINRYPECKGEGTTPPAECIEVQDWISSKCHQVQECLMDMYTNESLTKVRSDPACQELLANGGRSVTGTSANNADSKTCNVTESGLLAAMHLGGPSQCSRVLQQANSGSPPDHDGQNGQKGTDVTYYICKHGGLPVPNNCTPAPANTSDGSGVSAGGNQGGVGGGGGSIGGGGPNLAGPADPLRAWWVGGLMLMADQFTANMAAQVEAIGMMFDAKHQLESQRLFQQKTAQAHKDYQPSDQMCTFGTFARDLAATDRSANLTRTTLSQHILQRELGSNDAVGQTEVSDALSRLRKFRELFCDPADNAKGLDTLCPTPTPPEMRNRDINYTQTLDQPLSLAINMTDAIVTPDEETVFALVDNLFAHNTMPRIPQTSGDFRKYQYHYMNMRSIMAMRGIARNTMANLIALKTATPNITDATSNAPFLRALLREFGLTDAEVREMLGRNPSYYAQMEFLTRKIYQNPLFYSNLYDKPTNVLRVRAAMRAVKLMQDRDIQAALMRREMLMSMMLELRLRTKAEDTYTAAEGAMFGDDLRSDAPAGPTPGGGMEQ